MNNINLNDFVVSSRIRFARNFDGLPFPSKLTEEEAAELAKKIYELLPHNSFNLYNMKALDAITAGMLKEKHLISKELIDYAKNGHLILSNDEKISLMICEEDALRAQSIISGFCLDQAFDVLDRIDNIISQKQKYSFSTGLGYLTACPTNLGTGMRASCMMFLPALTMTDRMPQLINELAKINITVRGVYGEGSAAAGFLFQVSNSHSLGISEGEILAEVKYAVAKLADSEAKRRESFLQNDPDSLKDTIYRSYGILTSSYIMDTSEFMRQIALLKLGIYYGFFREADRDKIQKIITSAQACSLQKLTGRYLDGRERDIYRSKYVAEKILELDLK